MHKPRKPITTTKPLPLPTKRIKQTGKHWTKWVITRDMWFKQNKADSYTCHYCHSSLSKAETTLDHLVPRSRAPELRYDFANLVPCCFTCNGLKGSVAHDDYVHECYA